MTDEPTHKKNCNCIDELHVTLEQSEKLCKSNNKSSDIDKNHLDMMKAVPIDTKIKRKVRKIKLKVRRILKQIFVKEPFSDDACCDTCCYYCGMF